MPSPVFPSLAVLAARVGDALRERNETVAVAESSSGGLVSSGLLAIPGASAFFVGGAVVYTRTARKVLLGLTREDLVGMRAETEPYASLIAERIRSRLDATWGLGESGAAGPTGSPYGDPPGRVSIAVMGAIHRSRRIETGEADRATNMDTFARLLLSMFLEVIIDTPRKES